MNDIRECESVVVVLLKQMIGKSSCDNQLALTTAVAHSVRHSGVKPTPTESGT